MSDHIDESRLNDWVDGSLAATERQRVADHLDSCTDCRSKADRIAALRDELDHLPRQAEPGRDLWPAIAERIEEPPAIPFPEPVRGRARRSFSPAQLVAAVLAAALLSGGSVWFALRLDRPDATTAGRPVAAETPGTRLVDSDYDLAVAQLMETLAQRRSELDTATVRAIEENIATIDRAIADIRDALAENPDNEYLNAHLARALRQKAEVLRHAWALAGRS